MTDHLIEPAAVERLRSDFDGRIVTELDDDYEDVRGVFNSMLTARPRVVAQCATVADVKAALRYATENGLPVAVRGGGHSVAGACLVDGGLVVDLRRLNAVVVDPETQTAKVGGGAVWSEFDRACQPHGLATTGGRVSTTGVAGLTLGGGSGWIERKFGLACDNLLAVDLVTADGREVTASEQENPDLFWALHGGGGNFGVATELTFRLHEVPEFSIALLLWPADQGRAVAGVYRDLIRTAPEDVGGALLFMTGPPEEFVPGHLVGQLCCGVLVTHLGPETALHDVIGPLLATAPQGQVIADVPYADLQCMLDDPPGFRNYWSDENLRELPDEALDRFCERAYDMVTPSPSQQVLLPWGGAVGRGREWPGFNRDSQWAVHPLGLWAAPADDERAIAWARNLRADMKPWATGDVYLNFIGNEGTDRIVAGYGEENYRRLQRVKAEFDPHNVFNRWHAIEPA
ncbi:FAD-binding oxidoreductase [Amycolatopsis thermophila]|uniref:FAD/FMN-containing dehydrogenase n=1 Tax=Amycolatopsis thermophila TaxID=206084 RepID=A0ABU0EWV1_9PSEU|nr:FAD-binding oxidoreductase [Amycolatopsis thermophila]MDQ0379360.1 FAD/FMN-containing dehydrogenase [Amycolatopsis thermophila]